LDVAVTLVPWAVALLRVPQVLAPLVVPAIGDFLYVVELARLFGYVHQERGQPVLNVALRDLVVVAGLEEALPLPVQPISPGGRHNLRYVIYSKLSHRGLSIYKRITILSSCCGPLKDRRLCT
jgi:hypothetical protein